MKRLALSTIKLTFKLALVALGVVGILGAWLFSQFPSDKEIKGCLVTKMYHVELCPQSGQYTRLGAISENLIKAVVLTEDSAFFQHKGFDFQEMENSFKTNLEKGKFARGGSTISQQLAKNLFLTKEKTIQRKLLEALITLRMEKILSKKEILEKYLNVVQFGTNLFGIKSAADFYFKKTPAELSVNEAAFLTFLLPSPEKYSKSYFQGKLTPFARKRIQTIVERLYNYQRISEEQYLDANLEIDNFLSAGKKDSELNFEDIDESLVVPELDL